MSRAEVPQNLSVTHQMGDKSFVEIIKNHRGVVLYKEAPLSQQIPLNTIILAYQTALGLANMNPDSTYHFTRYDLEGQPETESNRPFKLGAMSKLIDMVGDVFNSTIDGKHS